MLEHASQHIACDFDVPRRFGTSHHECTALHRVAGPLSTVNMLHIIYLQLTPDWTFRLHAIICNRKFNMENILPAIF